MAAEEAAVPEGDQKEAPVEDWRDGWGVLALLALVQGVLHMEEWENVLRVSGCGNMCAKE